MPPPTENPYFYIYPAVLSRSTVFEFKSVSAADVAPAVRRGFDILARENETAVLVDDDAVARISAGCGGDVRKAMNSVENLFFLMPLGKRRKAYYGTACG